MSKLTNWDRHRRNLDRTLEDMARQQLGDVEPNWWPDTWTLTFVNSYLLKEDREQD